MKPLKGILLQLGSNQSSHDKSLSLSFPTNSLRCILELSHTVKTISYQTSSCRDFFFLKGECYSDFSERSAGSMEYHEFLFQVDNKKISLCMMSLDDSKDSMSVSHRSESAVDVVSFLFLCHKEG